MFVEKLVLLSHFTDTYFSPSHFTLTLMTLKRSGSTISSCLCLGKDLIVIVNPTIASNF